MPSNSSPSRTILNPVVSKDRIISKFPQAFHSDATPHQKLNFHPNVKDACSRDRTGTVGLKICKAVIVGDVAVGKTSLVNRFCHDTFDRDYKATIGVDFEVEKFSVLGIPFNLQVWDTAGQERFKCIAASYYRGANVLMVAFDLSDIESLDHARTWAEDSCKAANNPLVFLLGLKKDIMSDGAYRDIEPEAVAMANELGAEYWALSSKSGENVQEFFFRAVALTFDALVQRELESTGRATQQIGSDLIKINKPKPDGKDLYEKSRRSKCC